MNKYICIHGHFYQPPRDNPWLEVVEAQESAYPYHDWDERITMECYGPNTASRILDGNFRIIDIVNNYSRISFNFGPTLLAWMEKEKPDIYRSLIEADKESQMRYSGHGSALAQAYNHIIMPLANTRDKRTQIIWGIKDFERRFKRMPEGMWLAETAVDSETLDLLAEYGIKFTILAPRQARNVRPLGGEKWENVEGARVDPRQPYRCDLSSGRSIDIFFYDGYPSQEIAFSNLLENGEWLARRLIGTLSPESSNPQLANIATDGETYGHHRPHGDMALAFCLRSIEENPGVGLSIYGEYLEKYPPTHEVEVVENSSWSCAHGVERWRGNCGCNSGMHQGWTQAWRQPLRESLDWLRDSLVPIYEAGMRGLNADPWPTRDEYIDVVLDRSTSSVDQFIHSRTGRDLSPPEEVKFLKLLEMERQAMLMYTSCGWFFDEISGIETVQILRYAARALQLAHEMGGEGLEEEFISRLARAPSNIREFENGAKIYRDMVLPSRVDLSEIGVQYGVLSLFNDFPDESELYCYSVRQESGDRIREGKRVMALGQINLHSMITRQSRKVDYLALYIGDNTLMAGVRDSSDGSSAPDFAIPLKESFLESDLSTMIRLMDNHFPNRVYGLRQLLSDQQRKLARRILEGTIGEIETSMRKLTQHNYPITRMLREVGLPLPPALAATVECTINADLREAMKAEKLNLTRLKEAVSEANKWHFSPENGLLSRIATRRLNELIDRFCDSPKETSRLNRVESFLKVLTPLRLNISLWHAQNSYFALGKSILGEMLKRKDEGDRLAGRWFSHFRKLGDLLRVNLLRH
jgi:alpha-amylase/alpha-mannosidase (GH57 family)